MAFPFAPRGFNPRMPLLGRASQPQNSMQKVLNAIIAQQIVDQENQAPVETEQFSETEYLQEPEMPYLEGLSPMARYRDMGLRDEGRRYRSMADARAAVDELKAAQKAGTPTLREDVSMGVERSGNTSRTAGGGVITRSPGAPSRASSPNVRTGLPSLTPGSLIANTMAGMLPAPVTAATATPTTSTLQSPYGTGSSTTAPRQGPGTFSFTTPDGEKITAPFSALKDKKFMQFMNQEQARGASPVKNSRVPSFNRTYEDILAQLGTAPE